MMNNHFEIKQATASDVPLILSFIKELAEYEKLSHEVVATEAILKETLFGDELRIEGSKLDLISFFGLLEKPEGTFNLVTP